MERFIHSEVMRLVRPEDQDHVLNNINEDIEGLGLQSIIGLRVTVEELDAWFKR